MPWIASKIAGELLVLALLPCAARPGPGLERDRSDELRARLAALASSASDERLAARRWLATHVREEDLAQLGEAARAGDAEVRRALVEALGSDDQHLGLAARLAAADDAAQVELGSDAIGEMLARLGGGLERGGRTAEEWVSALGDRPPLVVELDSERGTLAEQLDRLARGVPGAPPIVLDPELDQHVREKDVDRAPGPGLLHGRFEEVLVTLCDLQRVELEVFGGDGGAPAWLHVQKKGAPAQEARALLVSWCVELVRPRTALAARASARALATSGWPAALAWLERRFTQGDPAARAGLVLAAGRGQVAPALAAPARVRELLDAMALGLARGDAVGASEAHEIARGLARLPSVAPGGEELAPLVLAGFDELGAPERTLRLIVVAGQRPDGPAAERAVRAALADPSPAASAQRFQALRAWSALPGRRPSGLPADALGAPRVTWAWAGARGLRGELVDLACALRLSPPPLEPDAAALDERFDLLEWWVFHGLAAVDEAEAARAAREVELRLAPLVEAAGGERATAALGGWARRGAASWLAARLATIVALEPGRAPGTLESLWLRCGGGSDEQRARLLDAALAAARQDGGAFRALAALCTDPELGERARAGLLALFDAQPEALAIEVLGGALEDLTRARLEDERRAFEVALRDLRPASWFLGRWRQAVQRREPALPALALDRLDLQP